MLVYLHDGTEEGILSSVFAAYERKERPEELRGPTNLQMRLDETTVEIARNLAHATRVRNGIAKKCGSETYDLVHHACLSDDPDAATVVYNFIRFAMQRSISNPLAHTTDAVVSDLISTARYVKNEKHRFVEFLRFEQREQGVFYAVCSPNAKIVSLLMPWFSGRFNTQPFIIYDEKHNMAGVSEQGKWTLIQTDCINAPCATSEEIAMQRAWKTFCRATAVEARYNPELQRSLMPKRFWRHMTEMQELEKRRSDRMLE